MSATVQSRPAARGAQADQQPEGEPRQFLTFSLSGESFAICISSVREIIGYGAVTPVPMSPDFVRGVLNLRGSIVPVIDLQARFGRGSSPITRRTSLVIVEVEVEDARQELGVVVDLVDTVLEIPRADILPPPTFGTLLRSEFISGIGKVNGKFIIILNVGSVLSVEEMAGLVTVPEADRR